MPGLYRQAHHHPTPLSHPFQIAAYQTVAYRIAVC